jgi:hypothetical protein
VGQVSARDDGPWLVYLIIGLACTALTVIALV